MISTMSCDEVIMDEDRQKAPTVVEMRAGGQAAGQRKRRTWWGRDSVFILDTKSALGLALFIGGILIAVFRYGGEARATLDKIEQSEHATKANAAAIRDRPTKAEMRAVVRGEVESAFTRASWVCTRVPKVGRVCKFNLAKE